MKKTFFALMLMCTSVLAVQAQSMNLTRTAWSTMLPGDEEIEMVLNFDDDGECYIILTHEEMQDDMIIRMSMSVPGIYSKEGQDLIISFNKKKADVNIDVDLSNYDSQTRALMERMLKPELKKMEPELKKDMLESIPSFLDNVKVVSVNSKKLVLGDDEGETITFYPTAKG